MFTLSEQIVRLPEDKRKRLLSWMKEAVEQTTPQEQWLKKLRQSEPSQLPEVYPVDLGTTMCHLRKNISPELFMRLQKWAHQTDRSLEQIFLTCFHILLVHVTGEKHVTFSVHQKGEVALFHTDCSDHVSCMQLLQRIDETWQRTFADAISAHELKPLVEQLKRETLGMMLHLDFSDETMETGEAFPWDLALSLNVNETPEIIVQYRSAVYSENTVKQLTHGFEVVMENVLRDPDRQLLDMCVLDQALYEQLTGVWSYGLKQEIPYDHLVQQWLTAVNRYADRPALTMADERLTYRDVDIKVKQWAHYLRHVGVSEGDRVGIYLPRSTMTVVAVLGTLMTGGTYVPLDATYPSDRLRYMLDDAGITYLITDSSLPRLDFARVKPIFVDLEQAEVMKQPTVPVVAQIQPDHFAYVIYTSGSTGEPKGVPISHRSVVNFVQAITESYEITEQDRILQFASFSFDVSVFDIFSSLLNGAELVIASEMDRRIPEQLSGLMMHKRITVAELPPALLPLLDSKRLKDLRLISVGGEKFPGKLVQDWATPNRRFMNGYGPTETTVAVTWFECSGSWSKTPPIGRPIANHSAYVLNEQLQPVPIGSPGELCIAGVGLSDGYLNAPSKTAERFVDSPFQLGSRLYRTGDLVRWLPDGNLEILGRTDRQVKIRGFRIELGEIESVLLSHPDVQEAAVDVSENQQGDKYLSAYLVVTDRKQYDPSVYREFLTEHLPTYMVPAKWVRVDEIPLTTNGKLDRDALRIKEESDMSERDEGGGEQGSEIEERIAKDVFGFLLDRPRVGIEDNFFDLGGSSLQATKAVSRVKEVFQVEVGLIEFFQTPTVKGLARLITDHQTVKDQKRAGVLRMIDQLQGGSRYLKRHKQNQPQFRLVCFHYAGGNSYAFQRWPTYFAGTGEIITVELPGHGVRIQEPCLYRAEDIARQLIPELEPLFDLPVALLGHSMGALVAFETGVQLMQKGLKPFHLFVAASRAPHRPPKTSIGQVGDDATFLNEMKQFGGLPEEVLANEEFLKVLIPMIRADVTVSESYAFSRNSDALDVPMSIFGATEDHLTKEELSAWGELTSERADVRMFSGGHFFLQQQEQEISTRISEKLMKQLNAEGAR